jgi:chromate transporter
MTAATATPSKPQQPAPTLSRRGLFLAFLRAGCAFGGGPGVMAVLEDELVHRRKVVSRDDFLAHYTLGRVVPSGTTSALAVAYGYRFGGLSGTVAALGGLLLPGVSLTILLTALYAALRSSPLLPFLSATLPPAALAFIVAAALRFGRGVFRPSLDLLLAAGALTAAMALSLHPCLILLAGGLIGAVGFSRGGGEGP